MTQATIVLPAPHPFRLDLTAWALRRRRKNTVDRWDDGQYSRVIISDGQPALLTAVQATTSVEPTLAVTVESATPISERALNEAGLLVQKMFGLAVDLLPFYKLADGDPVIGPLVQRFRGLRPPRFPTVFEGLVNAIACQQVTLDLGIIVLNRLAQRFGPHLAGHDGLRHAFPAAADLAGVGEETIRELGFSRQKARAIQQLAAHVVDRSVDLERLEGSNNDQAVAALTRVHGIGRWSAEYVLLRGLGRLDTFPGDDVGAQNNLQRLFHLAGKPTYDRIRQLTSPWRPYEGLVYFHLLLDKLRVNGAL
jgi:DNA-3-methyladenine glycosylase II